MKKEIEKMVNALMASRFKGVDACDHCGFEWCGEICNQIGCTDWDEHDIRNCHDWVGLVRENVEKFADSA
jgi:hypothetical protein